MDSQELKASLEEIWAGALLSAHKVVAWIFTADGHIEWNAEEDGDESVE